jgi:hypothetical protein
MKIFRFIYKFFIFTLTMLLIIVAIGLLILFFPALKNKWITYPRLEKEQSALWTKYKKPTQFIQKEQYKGVLHSHTYWSHDSRGTLPEILTAAKKAELDFIFLSDHARGKSDTFPRSFHGVFDGIIMEAGTESSSGLMVNPFDSTVLDWNKDTEQLIHEVVTGGGLVTYVHTEKEHIWDNPDYQAMEIYNIHTDLLDEDGILSFVINNAVNGQRYKDWCYRELYDEQTAILNNWDSLNLQRRIVGIGAVDAHNNQSFRARYMEDGKVEWVGSNAKTMTIRKPNWFDKLMLGEPDEFGWAYKWELDPYFESFNFDNNHVFCDTFSNENIKENIIQGHVFVSFESLANADGFQYFSTNLQNSISAILGDSVCLENAQHLKAVSPFPVKFQLLNNGKIVNETDEQYEYSYATNGLSGNYRIVARLRLDDGWVPWIYTNPIYVY